MPLDSVVDKVLAIERLLVFHTTQTDNQIIILIFH
jgi:hypothetical protein